MFDLDTYVKSRYTHFCIACQYLYNIMNIVTFCSMFFNLSHVFQTVVNLIIGHTEIVALFNFVNISACMTLLQAVL